MPCRVGKRTLNTIGSRGDLQERGVLRLSARSAVMEDKRLIHASRDRNAEILFHHRKRQVDPRRCPRGGPDGAVDDEDPIFYMREAGLELSSVLPWVVARRPSRRPAAAKRKVPLQMDATRRVACAADRRKAISPSIASAGPIPAPTIRVSRPIASRG